MILELRYLFTPLAESINHIVFAKDFKVGDRDNEYIGKMFKFIVPTLHIPAVDLCLPEAAGSRKIHIIFIKVVIVPFLFGEENYGEYRTEIQCRRIL